MRRDLLSRLRCPACRGQTFDLEVAGEDEREVRDGGLRCQFCGNDYAIECGIVDLMPEPSEVVRAEQAGWSEMLGTPPESMEADMLHLPYLEDDGIWSTTALNFDHAMELVDFQGRDVLDVGAGRCWSSHRILEAGARHVVATDILRQRLIGLETADVYLEAGGPYFERVLADMHCLPFEDRSFDVVFFTGTLHHSSTPGRVLREASRVTRPGGKLVLTNEPVRSLLRSGNVSQTPEALLGINENLFTIWTYLSAAMRAGFQSPFFFFPRSVDARLGVGEVRRTHEELGDFGYRLAVRLHRNRWGKKLLEMRPTLALFYLVASMPLILVATRAAGRN